jgi:hypothetical protein
MATPLFNNFARTILANSISAVDTVIPLSAGTGLLFPSPSAGQYVPLVLVDSAGNREVVHCTTRVVDNLTVTRGQEGTTARIFSAGDTIGNRLTAQALADFTFLADGDKGDIIISGGGTIWTLDAAGLSLAAKNAANTFTKAQRGAVVALADAATIAVDLELANNFSVTLGGNRTLGLPTNIVAGQSGIIAVTQDATGSRTLAYNAVYKFSNGTAPTLTTTASRTDYLSYYVETAARIFINKIGDVR